MMGTVVQRHLSEMCSGSSSEKAELLEQQAEVKGSDNVAATANGAASENSVNVLLNFEIQEVQSP